jgi:hypothetical protein
MTEQTKPIEQKPEQTPKKNNALRLSLWIGIPALALILILWVLHNWFGYWVCKIHQKWDFADSQCEWLIGNTPLWFTSKGVLSAIPFSIDSRLAIEGGIVHQLGHILFEKLYVAKAEESLKSSGSSEAQIWGKLVSIERLYGAKNYAEMTAWVEDENPIVRGYAIMRLSVLLWDFKETIVKALNDNSAFVRNWAVHVAWVAIYRETMPPKPQKHYVGSSAFFLPLFEQRLSVESHGLIRQRIHDIIDHINEPKKE